jgi:hypothetical protein
LAAANGRYDIASDRSECICLAKMSDP